MYSFYDNEFQSVLSTLHSPECLNFVTLLGTKFSKDVLSLELWHKLTWFKYVWSYS